MNDRQWDDYIRQQPNTFWGEWAWEHSESAVPKPPKNSAGRSKSVVSQPLTIADPGPDRPVTTRSSEPLFQWVDRLVDRLPQSFRTAAKVVLATLGALVAAAYSPVLGVPVWVAAAAGAVAGYSIPVLLFVAVKLALLAGLVGSIVALIYVVFSMIF